MKQDNRWIGLSSYNESDAGIFFGRSTEISEITNQIINNTSCIIYGPSGTGKTSIIRAGISPLLKSRGFMPVYIRFNHDSIESYSSQLYGAIIKASDSYNVEISQTTSYISNTCGSLWEYFHCNELWSHDDKIVTPIIIIDQFEEIFTLKNDNESADSLFTEFKNLLNDTCPLYVQQAMEEHRIKYETHVNFRLVIIVREDFLARIEERSKAIPVLKHNRYSLQILNGEQALEVISGAGHDIISGPISIKLIQKISSKADLSIENLHKTVVEPAILSLFCNELDKKRRELNSDSITSEMIDAFGDNIIKDFYENAMSKLSAQTIAILEEKLLTKDGYRNSLAISDALYEGISTIDLETLTNARILRIEERNGSKYIEFSHDVLCTVALNHKEQTSREKALLLEREKYIKLKIRNIRNIALCFCTFMIIAISWVTYCHRNIWTYNEYYSDLTWQNEFPIGINRLGYKDRQHMASYIKFSKNGSKTRHWSTVSYLDNKGNICPSQNSCYTHLINEHFEGAPGNHNKHLKEHLAHCCRYEVISDAESDFVTQIRAYDQEDNLIYCYAINENTIIDGKLISSTGQYTDSKGFPIETIRNGAQIIKTTYDEYGFREYVEFYDVWNNRAFLAKKLNGYHYIYNHHPDSLGLLMEVSGIDSQRHIAPDYNGNYKIKYTYDNTNGRWTKVSVRHYNTSIHLGVIEKSINDDWGRVTSRAYFDSRSRATIGSNNCHRTNYHYDKAGNVIGEEYLDTLGNLKSDGIAKIERTFTEDNNVNTVLAYDKEGLLLSDYSFKYAHNTFDDMRSTQTMHINDDLEPVNSSNGICIIETVRNLSGNITYEACFNKDGNLVGYENLYNYTDDLLSEHIISGSTKNDYLRILYKYDSRHKLTQIDTYDTPDATSPIKTEFMEYDRQGNVKTMKTLLFSPDVMHKSQTIRYEYDFWGNAVSIATFAADGLTPIERDGKTHKRLQTFDEYGNMLYYDDYDKNGRFVIRVIKEFE